jgi:hypothetical protein
MEDSMALMVTVLATVSSSATHTYHATLTEPLTALRI